MFTYYNSLSFHWIKIKPTFKNKIQNTTQPKQDEILPFAKTWIDLDGIMLSEISQMEKDKYYMISFIC